MNRSSYGQGCRISELTPDAIERLRSCVWRGNVRELQNVLEKAVMMTDKIRLGAADLVDVLPTDRVRLPFPGSEQVAVPLAPGDVRSYETELAEFERRLLSNVPWWRANNGSTWRRACWG